MRASWRNFWEQRTISATCPAGQAIARSCRTCGFQAHSTIGGMESQPENSQGSGNVKLKRNMINIYVIARRVVLQSCNRKTSTEKQPGSACRH